MAIQWSLVVFTVLTGTAGWMLVCAAIDAVRGKNQSRSFLVVAIALALLIVGGLASVTHLSHPDRMLAALSHPTSGIFVEAVLVGIIAVLSVAALVADRRGAVAAHKVLVMLAAVFGVVISFMAGESYLMAATSTWNSQLLPTGYALTAVPAGVAVYVAIVADVAEEGTLKLFSLLLIAGGVLGAVCSLAYVASIDAMGLVSLELYGGCLLCGGAVPVVCGAVMMKEPSKARVLAVVALAGALIGAVALRCIMWEVYSLVAMGAPFITDYALL